MSGARRIARLLMVAVILALVGGCTKPPEPEPTPTPPGDRWTLTVADVGSGERRNRSFGKFGNNVCLAPPALGSLSLGLPVPNHESAGIYHVDGDINVLSVVLQVDGTSTKEYLARPRPPQEVVSDVWASVNRCVQKSRPSKYPDRVSFEVLGEAPDFDQVPFEPSFGFTAAEVGPWASDEEQEKNPDIEYGHATIDDSTHWGREGYEEWFTAVWFTVADDSSIIMVAAEGPRDPSTVVDVQALAHVVAQRVNDDPPDPEWDWESQKGNK